MDRDRTTVPPRPETLIPSQRARRERIVDKAFEYLVHHPYDEIQVRDIATDADVALGTVYRYFTSKEHIFAAVLVRWGDAMRERVQRRPLASADTAGRLQEIYLRSLKAFERRPQFFRMLVVIENTTDPYARQLYEEFTKVSHAAFHEPLCGFEEHTAAAITNTLLAVLNASLRGWATGSITIDDARRRVTGAVDLIFSPAPQPIRAE